MLLACIHDFWMYDFCRFVLKSINIHSFIHSFIDHHKSTSLLDVIFLVKHLKILKLQHTITKWGASNLTDLEERPMYVCIFIDYMHDINDTDKNLST